MQENFTMKRNGFTLIELFVAMGVGAAIMAAVYTSMNIAQRSSVSVGRKIVTQQDVRAVLDLMAMEIRMASYNPVSSSATWNGMVLGNCIGSNITFTDKLNKGILVATTTSIALAMDLDSSGAIGDAANEYIVYALNGVNAITRNVNCGGGNTILGNDPNAPQSNTTRVTNTATNTPLFQYFDKDNKNITATVTINNLPNNDFSIGIPAIRRVRITIVADTQDVDSFSGRGRTKRMTYTTDILVKNHALL